MCVLVLKKYSKNAIYLSIKFFCKKIKLKEKWQLLKRFIPFMFDY